MDNHSGMMVGNDLAASLVQRPTKIHSKLVECRDCDLVRTDDLLKC